MSPNHNCISFNWFADGVTLAKCGTCGRPAWEHTGWLSDGQHRPFEPGELEEIKKIARRRGQLA